MEFEYLGFDLLTFSDIIIVPMTVLILYRLSIIITKFLFKNNVHILGLIKKAFWIKLIFVFFFFIVIFTIYRERNDQMGFYYHLQVMLPYISDDPQFVFKIFSSIDFSEIAISNLNSDTTSFLNQSGYFAIFKSELLFCLLSLNSFIALNIYGTYLGFFGCILMFYVLSKVYENHIKGISRGFFFIPTFSFYTCGIVKEGLAILAMGLIFYGIFCFKEYNKLFFILLVGIFVPIGFFAKPYIFLLFIPAIVLSIIIPKIVKAPLLVKILILVSLGTILFNLINIIGSLDERFILSNLVDSSLLVQEFTSFASENTDGKGNYDPISIDITSAFGVFKMILESLTTAFFRPYFWEAKTPLFLIVSLENSLLLYLFSRFLFRRNQGKKNVLFYLFIFFILPFSIFVSISNANFGSLLRYRAPIIPFLYSFLLVYGSKTKNITRS